MFGEKWRGGWGCGSRNGHLREIWRVMVIECILPASVLLNPSTILGNVWINSLCLYISLISACMDGFSMSSYSQSITRKLFAADGPNVSSSSRFNRWIRKSLKAGCDRSNRDFVTCRFIQFNSNSFPHIQTIKNIQMYLTNKIWRNSWKVNEARSDYPFTKKINTHWYT